MNKSLYSLYNEIHFFFLPLKWSHIYKNIHRGRGVLLTIQLPSSTPQNKTGGEGRSCLPMNLKAATRGLVWNANNSCIQTRPLVRGGGGLCGMVRNGWQLPFSCNAEFNQAPGSQSDFNVAPSLEICRPRDTRAPSGHQECQHLAKPIAIGFL